MRVDWKSFKKHWERGDDNGFPTGTRIYTGTMGKGKTLSMVEYTFYLKKKYPEARIFSNVKLFGVKYFHINDEKDLKIALEYECGDKGVIILIDEAHLLMNKRAGTPLEVVTAISMQRKDRKRIVMATQRWASMDIEARRQVHEVVECNNYFRKFQINLVFDGETVRLDPRDYTFIMDFKYREIYKHNIEYYERYDTYQRYVSNDTLIDTPAAAPTIVVQQASDGKKKKARK